MNTEYLYIKMRNFKNYFRIDKNGQTTEQYTEMPRKKEQNTEVPSG